jgi:hypothetical protein
LSSLFWEDFTTRLKKGLNGPGPAEATAKIGVALDGPFALTFGALRGKVDPPFFPKPAGQGGKAWT